MEELRQVILGEAHRSRYSIYPGATKMYKDLKAMYWWLGMKKSVARFPICWAEVGERQILGLKIVQETSEKIKLIRERIKKAQNRQKSYTDTRRRNLEFQVGDKMYLKISPLRMVTQSNKKNGKLSPRYIGPYDIVERIGPVAYRLALPMDLSNLYDVFHVSQLRKHEPEPSQVMPTEVVKVQENLSYFEKPVKILDRRD
ncbi:uncharacterized protein LOC127801582 [Diospyros lotus]|uniref:uncharacterized protein LOC127801582 n=1 Tax=Diospyros lotus TaxID=55363 RepID=UPI002255BF10|nr:uncharacterized protein LOC127801582 [Diospyros lotus]